MLISATTEGLSRHMFRGLSEVVSGEQLAAEPWHSHTLSPNHVVLQKLQQRDACPVCVCVHHHAPNAGLLVCAAGETSKDQLSPYVAVLFQDQAAGRGIVAVDGTQT